MDSAMIITNEENSESGAKIGEVLKELWPECEVSLMVLEDEDEQTDG